MLRTFSILLSLATVSVVIPKFFGIGFMHILPNGLDHILFILGLFFLNRSFSVLLFQMTLFTLAHSLTLGLALYGIVSVPTSVVEIAIALSIAFIALENLISEQLRPWRPWVVFGCGLIHGLGFAHSFQRNLANSEEFLPALFSFNLGIEIGQLTIVGIAYGVFAIWWKRDWYLPKIARPASVAIALSGFYWAALRSF